MYAIIKTGGKQYRVAEGDVVMVEKLAANEGEAVTFDQVLTVVKDDEVVVGKPLVEGAKVTAKVEAQGKDKKILVFKYKAKSNYRRRQGHRQQRQQAEDQRGARGADLLQAEIEQRDQHRELANAQGRYDGDVSHS